jgi:pimeloyl-ACP methyl ester carboxylesterase
VNTTVPQLDCAGSASLRKNASMSNTSVPSALTNPSSTTTVVLVHGAWHGAWCFDDLVTALKGTDVSVVAIDLPGHGSDTRALGPFADDVAALVNDISSIEGKVVLLGHSYGGLVITEAAADSRISDKINHLIYLCALCLAPGSKSSDIKAGRERGLLNPLIRMEDNGLATIITDDLEACRACFYGDCTAEQVLTASQKICAQPIANLGSIIQSDPMRTIATTYVVCTEDRTIPVETQRAMIAAVRATGIEINERELPSSHSPFLSMPNELAAIIMSVL